MSAASERTDPAGYFHNDDNHENVKLCSVEAKAAIAEVGFGVKEICLASSSLPFTDTLAYLNLTTLEGEKMCVEISVKGFCPVGSSFYLIDVYILLYRVHVLK
ncbi:GSK3-beta interaction protein [Schistosoma japonicum]|nr:GSK3-beta interaction protein [Schistosoma japonicum]